MCIDMLDRGASLFADRACLIDDTGTKTYADVSVESHRIANALRRDGAGFGKHVAILSPNASRAFECILGVFRAGAVWVPLNARNATEENAYILDNTDVTLLFYHSRFEPEIAQLREGAPRVARFVCLDKRGGYGTFYEDWLAGVGDVAEEAPRDPESLCAIVSSGGTTGRPKGVMHTHRLWEAVAASYHTMLPTRKPAVHLVAAPMTHAAGIIALPLLSVGATQVIQPGADPLAIMQAIETHKVTHLFLPPTVIYMMLAHPRVREFDYSSLDYFIYAAAPMSVDKLKQSVDVFGPVMCQVYGQVEAPMYCTVMTPEEHVTALTEGREQRLWSCGRPSLYTRVAIMDDDEHLLETGERGEIVVRSSLVMKGYYRNPEATAEASAHGWHHTGDIGYCDEDGYVYIVDRKRDMIISGGFNVFPSEIEQVVWAHPAVQDCAVIGIPDEKWGEAVTAVIELRAGAAVSEAEIIALCKQHLGGVKAPKSVLFWDKLPRSPVGKVLKKDIRARFWEGHSRSI